MAENPWITAADASTLTGVTLTAAQVNAAAEDIYDVMRWQPDPAFHFVGGTMFELRQKSALGRAIALTAAFHTLPGHTVLQQMERLTSDKSIGRWRVRYGRSEDKNPFLPPRAFGLLAGAALIRNVGTSTRGKGWSSTDYDPITDAVSDEDGPFIPIIP